MAAAIRYLLTSTNLDGCFVVGENCERIAFVKQLVANCSPVFRRMLFDSDMKETGDIVMPDIHPEAIKLYLKFAYGALEVPSIKGEMTGWSPEICLHVVDFTEKYEIPQLQEIALTQLKPTGVDDLFPALHCVALYSGAASMAGDVQKIIQENIKKILQSPDFLQISLESLLYILKQEVLSVTEVELFNATVAWAKHQGQTDNVVKIKPLMTAPLQHLRLLTMSHDDLFRHIEPSKLFSLQEIIDLGKAISKLPVEIKFCDNSEKKRVTPAPKTVSVDLHQVFGTYGQVQNSTYVINITEKSMEVSKIVFHSSQYGNSLNCSLNMRIKKNQIIIWEFQNAFTCTYNQSLSLSWEKTQSVVLEPHSQYILEMKFGQNMYGVYFNLDPNTQDPHGYIIRDGCPKQYPSCSGHTFSNGRISCIHTGSLFNKPVSHIKMIEFTEV